MKAAWLYDQGEPCGVQANAAKYLAAEAAYRACKQAVVTHGGMGYAREFHVERLLREVMIPYLAPLSQQMALSQSVGACGDSLAAGNLGTAQPAAEPQALGPRCGVAKGAVAECGRERRGLKSTGATEPNPS